MYLNLIFNLCLSALWGQIGTNFNDTLVQNINTFSQQYSQEKVYLHFDNTSYFLGEKIWYKANVVNADQHCPSPLSAVLYVDLLFYLVYGRYSLALQCKSLG